MEVEKSNVETSEEKDELLGVLQELEEKEKFLLGEKENLVSIKEKLKAEISQEVYIRKCRIDALENEIAQLKRQCEELAKALNTLISE